MKDECIKNCWVHECRRSAEVLGVELEALLWVGLVEGANRELPSCCSFSSVLQRQAQGPERGRRVPREQPWPQVGQAVPDVSNPGVLSQMSPSIRVR